MTIINELKKKVSIIFTSFRLSKRNLLIKYQQGFTLVEVMIVVAILAIVTSISYPSYQRYVAKTKRVAMLTELQSIAGRIKARKLVAGSYSGLSLESINSGRTQYPYSGQPVYDLIEVNGKEIATGRWTLLAKPLEGAAMANDGNLTVNFEGKSCHQDKCSNNTKVLY